MKGCREKLPGDLRNRGGRQVHSGTQFTIPECSLTVLFGLSVGG
jgi:hypothetical protein